MISINSLIPIKYIVISSVVTFAFAYFLPFLMIFFCSFQIGRELAKNRKNKIAKNLKKEFYARQKETNNA